MLTQIITMHIGIEGHTKGAIEAVIVNIFKQAATGLVDSKFMVNPGLEPLG